MIKSGSSIVQSSLALVSSVPPSYPSCNCGCGAIKLPSTAPSFRRLVPSVRVTVHVVASFPEYTLRKWRHIRDTHTDSHLSSFMYWYPWYRLWASAWNNHPPPPLHCSSPFSTGTPKHIDYEDVRDALQELEGVKHAHSLHIWSLTLNKTALSAHLALGTHTETIILAHHIEEKVAYNHSKNRISSLHCSYSYS